MSDGSENKEDVVSLDDLDLSLDEPLGGPEPEVVAPVQVTPPPPASTAPASSSTPPPIPAKIPDAETHLEAFLAEKAPDLLETPVEAPKPKEPEGPSKAYLFFKEVFAKLKRLFTIAFLLIFIFIKLNLSSKLFYSQR